MRGRRKDQLYKELKFLLFSLKPTTDLENLPSKGYAGRTSRLDIPLRTAWRLFSSCVHENLDLRVSIVLHGPPSPPLHVLITKDAGLGELREERMLFKTLRDAARGSRKGILVERKGFSDVLKQYVGGGLKPYLLCSNGVPITEVVNELGRHPTLFIMGTDVDVPEFMLRGISGVKRVSVGPREYLTSHVALFAAYMKLLAVKGLKFSYDSVEPGLLSLNVRKASLAL